MAHVSHKLSGSIEGALAGGGDPATSPLYVFGPFLRLLVAAGVGSITLGASIWLAVITVVTVSAMYRMVMLWITDGSGGSGLNEEEFGPWAVKVNAGITIVEYSLTFLVSMAALVTFAADRVPMLGERVAGFPIRTGVAIAFSLITAFGVNRGPKIAARTFGPATASVLLLLWTMILASIWRFGFHLPSFHLSAFSRLHIGLTLDGYSRILALMTGIEIFANLVAAYDGPARERSRKAFGSLVIVMGTTSLTMLVVGPAIYELSNPLDARVSVFTQTMDKLLPGPLAYAGTLIGIAVLLSAAAASVQGIQNLALGLRYRHYIPAYFGQKNRFDVADKPVLLIVGICIGCFLFFGTNEDTYLALYAAGVFILLSLTGWAVVKRLARKLQAAPSMGQVLGVAGTLIAALLTTMATITIFVDRFWDGGWTYLLFIPVLYITLDWFRRRLGPPSPLADRLGTIVSASYLPGLEIQSSDPDPSFHRILVPLDGSTEAELAVAIAQTLARAYDADITLLSVIEKPVVVGVGEETSMRSYLSDVADQIRQGEQSIDIQIRHGDPSESIGELARSPSIDAVVMTAPGRTQWPRWLTSNVTSRVIYQTTPPIVLLRPTENWRSRRTRFKRLLVPLDGSETAEQVLPYVYGIARRFKSDVILLSIPEGSDSDGISEKLSRYLNRLKESFNEKQIPVSITMGGSAPAQTIVRVAAGEQADLIMMVTHGQGGVERQSFVKLGSVPDRVIQEAPCPVFLVSAQPSKA